MHSEESVLAVHPGAHFEEGAAVEVFVVVVLVVVVLVVVLVVGAVVI